MLAARSKKYAPTVENVQDRRSLWCLDTSLCLARLPTPSLITWKCVGFPTSQKALFGHMIVGELVYYTPITDCPGQSALQGQSIQDECCLHSSLIRTQSLSDAQNPWLPSQKGKGIVLDSFSVPHYFESKMENLNRNLNNEHALQGPLELNCHLLLKDWFLTLSHQVVER